jgi:hypothetical protein
MSGDSQRKDARGVPAAGQDWKTTRRQPSAKFVSCLYDLLLAMSLLSLIFASFVAPPVHLVSGWLPVETTRRVPGQSMALELILGLSCTCSLFFGHCVSNSGHFEKLMRNVQGRGE